MSLKQDKTKEIHVHMQHNQTTVQYRQKTNKQTLESSQRKHIAYGTITQIMEISHKKPRSSKEHGKTFLKF